MSWELSEIELCLENWLPYSTNKSQRAQLPQYTKTLMFCKGIKRIGKTFHTASVTHLAQSSATLLILRQYTEHCALPGPLDHHAISFARWQQVFFATALGVCAEVHLNSDMGRGQIKSYLRFYCKIFSDFTLKKLTKQHVSDYGYKGCNKGFIWESHIPSIFNKLPYLFVTCQYRWEKPIKRSTGPKVPISKS